LGTASHEAGDKHLRANKPALPVCSETQKKAEHNRELWAAKVFARAAETIFRMRVDCRSSLIEAWL